MYKMTGEQEIMIINVFWLLNANYIAPNKSQL